MVLIHTIETDGRQADVIQHMVFTYTIETDGKQPGATPGRFFCLRFKTPLYHYFSPTATRTASLSRVRPQAAIGRAESQSAEWGLHPASSLARSTRPVAEPRTSA